MREIRFREALCEAMSEEMRRDDRVFLMGEEVAQYNGAPFSIASRLCTRYTLNPIIHTPKPTLPYIYTFLPYIYQTLPDSYKTLPNTHINFTYRNNTLPDRHTIASDSQSTIPDNFAA